MEPGRHAAEEAGARAPLLGRAHGLDHGHEVSPRRPEQQHQAHRQHQRHGQCLPYRRELAVAHLRHPRGGREQHPCVHPPVGVEDHRLGRRERVRRRLGEAVFQQRPAPGQEQLRTRALSLVLRDLRGDAERAFQREPRFEQVGEQEPVQAVLDRLQHRGSFQRTRLFERRMEAAPEPLQHPPPGERAAGDAVEVFVEVEAGIVARKDHPLHARRAGLEDLAGWPWVDYDGAAPADGDAGGRPSLSRVLDDLYERTCRRARTVIRAAPAGPFPMASGPNLAWLPLKFLHAFDRDLQPLPVRFGRHRYRTGFIARRSAEDLATFRLLQQAVRDAALEKSGRPPG